MIDYILILVSFLSVIFSLRHLHKARKDYSRILQSAREKKSKYSNYLHLISKSNLIEVRRDYSNEADYIVVMKDLKLHVLNNAIYDDSVKVERNSEMPVYSIDSPDAEERLKQIANFKNNYGI